MNYHQILTNLKIFTNKVLEKLLAIAKKIFFLIGKVSQYPKTINSLAFIWGAPVYILAMISAKILRFIPSFFDITISSALVIYLIWHIIEVAKIKPKKLKLSKGEELKILAKEQQKGSPFLRKLLLKESIFKFNPYVVLIVIDIIFIAHFSQIIFG
jgi:hypothetical protein